MNSFLRRHKIAIFVATMTVFLASLFVGYGGYLVTSRDRQGVAAVVGPIKIPYATLSARVDLYAERLREGKTPLDDAKLSQLKHDVLMSMMVDEMLSLKADELGLKVTDEDLARDIRSTPDFAPGGRFSQQAYFAVLRQALHQTPQEYEAERRRELKAQRLKVLFLRQCKVSPEEARLAYASAHKGSDKGFEKDGPAFAAKLQQQRAYELINYALRQMQAKDQIHVENRLSQIEAGS